MKYPEEWIKFLMFFLDIDNLMPLKDSSDKKKIIWALLKVQALPLNII
jgi:hypothetical protein